MSNQKLKFEDLEYIVMEGGGARGAAYLGAVRALEKKMAQRQKANPTVIGVHNIGQRKTPGLLDYYYIDNANPDNKRPVLKGIAGSSAGAINTFALALGFNSEEMEKISRYEFENFLQEKDVGKYRMVDKDGNLAIGQDKKNTVTGNKELAWDKVFKFDFDADKTEVNDNLIKRGVRNSIFTLGFKILVDGVVLNSKPLLNLIDRLLKLNVNVLLPNILPWLNGFKKYNNTFIQKLGWSKLLQLMLFKVIFRKKLKAPLLLDFDTVGNVLFDRGMFSGFAVREFFLDMLIMASTNETQFQRGFLELYGGKKIDEKTGKTISERTEDKVKALKKALDEKGAAGFEIGKRSKAKLTKLPDSNRYVELIQSLTFQQLNEITKINFGLCVSNFTTDSPIYFGYEWTPNFKVMEAVAGSMSIPPAIKPIYNSGNVVATSATDEGNVPFVKPNGEFELADYYFYEHLVKMALAELVKSDPEEERQADINVNNGLDISIFLPKLRQIATLVRIPKGLSIKEFKASYKKEINVGGKAYTIDTVLYKFFYNAVYKGMFFDGGYRNNIPYNFFYEKNLNIDTVFAIKLDGSFPPPLMDKVNKAIREYIVLDNRIDTSNLESDDPLLKQLLQALDAAKAKALLETQAIYLGEIAKEVDNMFNETNGAKQKELMAGLKKDKLAVERLLEASIAYYRKVYLTPPWAVAKPIFAFAFEGYSYGAERGQIKKVTDHNQILPLYDYGVSVYDFDMKVIRPMVSLAQAKAEEDTTNFFNNENSK